MTQEKSIDEIFGEYWHLDWQELPDECRQWLIDKNSNDRYRSGFTEARIEINWNRDRQKDPTDRNKRRDTVEMLAYSCSPDCKTKLKEFDTVSNANLRAEKNVDWLKSERRRLENPPDGSPYYGNPFPKIDADIQSAEAERIERTAQLDALLGNSDALDLPMDTESLALKSHHALQVVPGSRRPASVTKETQSAAKFGRAYQKAIERGSLSKPLTMSQKTTAVASIKRELEMLGETLADNTISKLVIKLIT